MAVDMCLEAVLPPFTSSSVKPCLVSSELGVFGLSTGARLSVFPRNCQADLSDHHCGHDFGSTLVGAGHSRSLAFVHSRKVHHTTLHSFELRLLPLNLMVALPRVLSTQRCVQAYSGTNRRVSSRSTVPAGLPLLSCGKRNSAIPPRRHDVFALCFLEGLPLLAPSGSMPPGSFFLSPVAGSPRSRPVLQVSIFLLDHYAWLPLV